jgi:GTP-binding protein Era
VPAIVVINKIDTVNQAQTEAIKSFFAQQSYCKKVVAIAALRQSNLQELLDAIVNLLPEGDAFYNEEDLTDLPTKFFVGEMVREKIYELFGDEIPYHATVLVNEFKEKDTLTKIQADIVVQRETQKAILIGEGGKMIKKIGSLARADIESFLQRKVFLELFVKVRPKWRDNELYLKEYGYY